MSLHIVKSKRTLLTFFHTVLLRCLALLNPSQGRTDEGEPVAESSAAGASRGR